MACLLKAIKSCDGAPVPNPQPVKRRFLLTGHTLQSPFDYKREVHFKESYKGGKDLNICASIKPEAVTLRC